MLDRPLVLLVILLALGSAAPNAAAQSKRWTDLGSGTGATLEASNPRYGRPLWLRLSGAPASSSVFFVIGLSQIDLPVPPGTLVPSLDLILPSTTTPLFGTATISVDVPFACGIQVPLYLQAVVLGPGGLVFSNALTTVFRDEVPSDFNGDGLSDLAIGVPDEDYGGGAGIEADAGAVNVVYGGDALPARLIRQGDDLNGMILNAPEAGDRFGAALATGDFDGDGFCDLAIGVPQEDSVGPTRTDSGIVQVLYGSPAGLQGGGLGRNDQLFRQGQNGLADGVHDFDWFGKSLAACDFDGDGCCDLAIGVPFENLAQINQGAVHVLFGSATGGLSGQGSLLFTEAPGSVSPDDRFGWSLAAGDFNRDGFCELAVGHPYEDIGGLQDAGAVTIVHPGTLALPTPLIRQGANIGGLIAGAANTFDLFGFSLCAGDFDGDGDDDLAIGVPFEDVSGASAAGAVNVLYGSPVIGLSGIGNELFTQDTPGLLDSAELSDRFGYSLAAGDFDLDGNCDLAIGVPRERIGGIRLGAIQVLYGNAIGGLTFLGNQLWHQNVPGVLGVGAEDDAFGWAIFAGDFDGDCRCDLAVGIPGEDVNGENDAGAVQLFFGGAAGISAIGDEIQTQVPLPGAPQAGDRMGAALVGSLDQGPL